MNKSVVVWCRGHVKYLSASGLVIIGFGLALRSLWPLLMTPDFHAPPAPLTDVASGLGPELLDQAASAEATPESILEMAQERLRRVLDAGGPGGVVAPERCADLVTAFGERLIATLDGQYDRDMAARVARGMARPDPPTEVALTNYKKTADWTRGTRVGLDLIEARVIYDHGDPVAPSPVEEGYEALTYEKHGPLAFPLSGDPQAKRLDVVEVRLPMGLKPVQGESRGAVLVGYQFAWSAQRSQWIPLCNVIYQAQGEHYAGLPF